MVLENELNAAFVQWVEQSKVSAIIKDKHRFIAFIGKNEIDVDFQQLPEQYVNKFITDNMEGYCLQLLKSIEKTMFATLARVEVKDYQFHFSFRYYGKQKSKTVNYYLLSKVA